MPPTQSALRYAILRAHYQAMVWRNDVVANPKIPQPDAGYGWERQNGTFVPQMTTMQPAPQAILELVKCSCKKSRCSTLVCKCRRHGFPCTDMCESVDPDDDVNNCFNRNGDNSSDEDSETD